jgi:NTP pyrophosphatase (non-canonical NTP hydrolase)
VGGERRVKDEDATVDELKAVVRRFCEARDWDQFHGAKDLAIGVITEAAELLEHFRFRSEAEAEALFDHPESRSEIEAEVADVLIFVLRLAQKYEIDLASAVESKLEANERRYPVETARGSNRKAMRSGS